MKALVIGAGGVGSAIANIASRRPFIKQMVLADRNLSRAEAAITKLKDSRFSAAEVNAAELGIYELLFVRRSQILSLTRLIHDLLCRSF